MPGTNGGSNFNSPYRPRIVSMSLKSRQNVSVATRTWFGPGGPTSTVRISRASVGAPSRAATQAVAATGPGLRLRSVHHRVGRAVVGHRQLLDAVEPRRPKPPRSPEEAHVGQSVGDGIEHDPHLEPGQVGTDAEVRPAAAERHVRVGGPADVETSRILVDLVIEVGRRRSTSPPDRRVRMVRPPISVSSVAVRWSTTAGEA